MSEYKLYPGEGTVRVIEADECKIEDGGVLAFYEMPDGVVASSSNLVKAFNDWAKVESV